MSNGRWSFTFCDSIIKYENIKKSAWSKELNYINIYNTAQELILIEFLNEQFFSKSKIRFNLNKIIKLI